MFHKFLRLAIQAKLGNCDARKRMSRFCEACNGCCFYFFWFDQIFSCKNSLFKLLFETQPACVSQKFLNFCLISAGFSYRQISYKEHVFILSNWSVVLLTHLHLHAFFIRNHFSHSLEFKKLLELQSES